MIPAQAATGGADVHETALLRAYELVEAAQDRDVTGELQALDTEATTENWEDVRLLLHFARSLASRETGQDDTEQVRAMLESAQTLGDPALLALALATTAMRAADARWALAQGASAAEPLVQAVVLLDNAESLVVHRVAAHLEVAGAFHALGLWPLVHEHFALVQELFEQGQDGPWADVLLRQRRVVAYNSVDMALDEACALAEVGDWEGARRVALPHAPLALVALTEGWPQSWAAALHAFAEVFAALGGLPSAADRDFIASQAAGPATDTSLALLSIADAIRAHRAGDHAGAARLAEAGSTTIGPNVPVHVRLLALNLASHTPQTPAVALTYLTELVSLSWNSRLSRLSSVQAAVDAERRRVEHEFLRGQVLVDDLTGLGNRRAYSAYLERVRRAVAALAGEGTNGGRRTADRRHHRRQNRVQPAELVIMMIDVDHFKTVNDSYGHDVGDEVLRRIGSILAAQVRSGDLAARLGGDEFVVIMTLDAEDVGEARAAAFVEAVRDHPWDELAPGLSISISLGLNSGPARDLALLPAEADRRLYVAKRSGRGRVAGRAAEAG